MDDPMKREVKKAEDGGVSNTKLVTKPYPAWADKVPFPPRFTQPEFTSINAALDAGSLEAFHFK